MVTETEPEVGEVRLLKDDIARNGNMANRAEAREACEPEEIAKVIFVNPPGGILHLMAESESIQRTGRWFIPQ